MSEVWGLAVALRLAGRYPTPRPLMKIGIDGCALSGHLAGIGRYQIELCRELDGILPDATFVLYSPKPLAVQLPSHRWSVRVGGGAIAKAASSYAWLKLCAGPMAERDGVTLFWAPRTILPARSRAFRTVTSAYDLNVVIAPETMPIATYHAHRLCFEKDLRRADAVVAISRGTAGRLHAHYGIEADAVVVPAVDHSLFHRIDNIECAKVLQRYQVQQPYFLTVATREPRKNLDALVDAFVSLKHAGSLKEYSLLIAGHGGWRNRQLKVKVNARRELRVTALGYVPDDDLPALYSAAHALVIPSLYEGFGIPALEARACGTQVVATDTPELREAGGERGIYFPLSGDGIRSALLGASETTLLPTPYSATWRESATILGSLFRELSEKQ